jgi:hypothetical protein
MSVQPTQAAISIDAGDNADPEELQRLSLQLRRELLGLDVEDVTIAQATTSEERTKAADALTWGSLLVTLGAAKDLLPSVIGVVQSWLSRESEHSVTMEIDGEKLVLSGASSDQVQQFIDQWFQRHQPDQE